MTRYGAQFGPDITFLGVDRVDLDDADALAAADVVIVGAPFDGGTSNRPGTRFGPMAIRQTDYLPQDGSRPHMALRVDALQDIRVVDAGDVEMAPGEIERALGALEDAVYAVASPGAIASAPRRPAWPVKRSSAAARPTSHTIAVASSPDVSSRRPSAVKRAAMTAPSWLPSARPIRPVARSMRRSEPSGAPAAKVRPSGASAPVETGAG